MEPAPTPARQLWQALEPLHSVVYFSPEPAEAAAGLGLRGGWMGYFAGRFAPLGPLSAGPATSMAFGFAPQRVARALPDAWTHATPERVLETRIEAVGRALRRTLGASLDQVVDELGGLLGTAVEACRYDARPLAAGWAEVDRPTDPVPAFWLLTTILREHRGDGHVLAAVSLGLTGLEAAVTHVASGIVPRELLQKSRGWTDEEWEESQRSLQARGLVDGDGHLTDSGRCLRQDLEEATDRLAAGPVEGLGPDGFERALHLARPLSRSVMDDGLLPVPNPIGVPRP